MEPRGDRGDLSVMLDIDAEDVEDALEWVLLWKERMDDTDDEVEFRPPRPRPAGRRYEACGVSGPGEREVRFGGGVPRFTGLYAMLPLEFLRVPYPERELNPFWKL